MTLAYWILLLSFFLPSICAGIAKGGRRDYNNANPREWETKLDGYRARAVAALLAEAGFDAPLSDRIRAEVWYKLWGNMTMNPVSALTGATADRIIDDPLVARFSLAVMAEEKTRAGAFILAADTATFGQPEITIGTIPGAGGTQRLTRFVGKSKAMEMCLTGRTMDAAEAERCGLVSRVVPAADLVDEAVRTADRIAALSRPAVMMAKEAVNRAFETTLEEGVRFERRLFHATFATEDQKEGMAAFAEKRPPAFRNR
jgi:hypothetical protein